MRLCECVCVCGRGYMHSVIMYDMSCMCAHVRMYAMHTNLHAYVYMHTREWVVGCGE